MVAIIAATKVCRGKYAKTNNGPALSTTHICIANTIADATKPCSHQYMDAIGIWISNQNKHIFGLIEY